MRAPALLLGVACVAVGGPARGAPPPATRVIVLQAPAGRVHTVLTGAVTAPPNQDVLLLVDDATAEGPVRKYCLVFPPRPTAPGYAAAPASRHPLPLDAGLAQCADVDGDGHADLVYLTRRGVFVFAGGPTGLTKTPRRILERDLFIPPATDRVGAGTFLVDVTDDGRPDLLLPVAEGLSLHAQGADGRYRREPTALLRFPVMSRMYTGLAQTWVSYRLPYVMVRDLDHDGRRDVAVLDMSGGYRFRQTAPGAFTADRLAGDLARDAGNSFTFALFGDWNGDGNPDAAFARLEQRRVVNSSFRLHWGQAGRLPADPGMTLEAPSTVMFPVFLDATGDGRSELLLYRVHFGLRFAINYFLRNRILIDVAVHQLGPNGTYDTEPAVHHRMTVAAFDGGGEPVRVPADVNGDGAMDMAVGLDPDTLGVFLGDRTRILQGKPAWTVPVAAYGIPTVADLNGDGRDDLLIMYPEPEKQRRVSVVLSVGPEVRAPVASLPLFN